MEQFDERILMTVNLPSELPEDDLIAVARIHFPELSELHLKYVVNKALATERNYVSDIEKIATLAKYKAKANGRSIPLLADINAAIGNVLPSPAIQPPPAAAPGALIALPSSRGDSQSLAQARGPRSVSGGSNPAGVATHRRTSPGSSKLVSV